MEKSLLILAILLKTFAVTTAPDPSKLVSFNILQNQEMSVCLDNPPIEENKFVLIPSIGNQQLPSPVSNVLNGSCITFTMQEELTDQQTEDAHFVFNGFVDLSTTPTITLEANFTIPEFPAISKVQIVSTASSGSDDKNILRIAGDMKLFTIDITADQYQNSALNVTYYFGTITQSVITPCTPVTAVTEVCDISHPIDSPLTIGEAITVASGILKYDETGSTDAKITIAINPTISQEKIDILFIAPTPADSEACTGRPTIGATCPITWTPGITQADIRIVTLDSADIMTDYIKNPIQDHELAVAAISKTTVEGRWKKDTTLNKFKLTAINNFGVPATSDPITVDCANLLNYCLGYITGLTDADNAGYTLRIQESEDDTFMNFREERQIESMPATTIPTAADIRDIQMDWYHKDERIRARVCFNHTAYDVRTEFSHYEFLLINARGQWIKHALRTTKAGVDCFSPYTISPSDFDVSEGAKLIVMQRAMDQFTVLASGETDVF